MIEIWEEFICDKCGKRFRSRTDDLTKNNDWLTVYEFESFSDGVTKHYSFCSSECCHNHIDVVESAVSEFKVRKHSKAIYVSEIHDPQYPAEEDEA